MAPQYITGNIWDLDPNTTDGVIVTGNGLIARDGLLVMGAGSARQSIDRFPRLRSEFTRRAIDTSKALNQVVRDPMTYFFVKPVSVIDENQGFFWNIGLLQTKWNWRDSSSRDLIRAGVSILSVWAMQRSRVDLVFPGIGLGGLDRDIIKDDLDFLLPPNVNVWELPK